MSEWRNVAVQKGARVVRAERERKREREVRERGATHLLALPLQLVELSSVLRFHPLLLLLERRAKRRRVFVVDDAIVPGAGVAAGAHEHLRREVRDALL